MSKFRPSACVLSIPRRRASTAAVCVLALCVAACTPPPDTPTDKPTEPRATGLRDAVRAPLDTAEGAQTTVDEAAAKQRQAIEDAGG